MNKINANVLRDILISGSNNLSNNYNEIDSLNVFPIPDGDTGTNMMMTLKSGLKEMTKAESDKVGEVAKSFSRGLLLGARGNSGVITSQIFRGFAEYIKEKSDITVKEFAEALVNGQKQAYKAVLKPVEGTMLTVIRESSTSLKNYATENNETNFLDAFKELLASARKSLAKTPELLYVLKEAGVIDSGGAGLVKIFEGFATAIDGQVVVLNEQEVSNEHKGVNFEITKLDGEEFGYCTEFILDLNKDSKVPFSEESLSNFLQSIGNSTVVAVDDNIVKVHVHTLKPGDVLNFAQQYGEFITLKIENMDVQHDNIPKKHPQKEQAIVTVAVGDGLTNLFKTLRADLVISGGQTMNPSTEDFVKAISSLNAKKVIVLPNNSNIILSAKQAAELLADKIELRILPTTSIQQGLTACMGFNPELDMEDNLVEMMDAIKRVTCGQITYAVRNTKMNGVTIRSGDFIGIKEKTIVSSGREVVKASCDLLDKMITYNSEIVTLITGSDISIKDVTSIEKYLKEKYKHIVVEKHQGDQPVYYLLISVE